MLLAIGNECEWGGSISGMTERRGYFCKLVSDNFRQLNWWLRTVHAVSRRHSANTSALMGVSKIKNHVLVVDWSLISFTRDYSLQRLYSSSKGVKLVIKPFKPQRGPEIVPSSHLTNSCSSMKAKTLICFKIWPSLARTLTLYWPRRPKKY